MKADFTAAGVTLRLKVNNGPFTPIPNTGYSTTISLNVGSNIAILRVASTDGTSRDYTFTLTRSAAAAGLTPSFGTPTATSGGFTVQISNYSSSYSWGVTTTVGSATINDSGLITVTGLSGSATTIAVTSRRIGYANARSTLNFP
jgi:titin